MIDSYKGFKLDFSRDTMRGKTYEYTKDIYTVVVEFEEGSFDWTVYKEGNPMPFTMGKGESIEDCLDKTEI